MQVKVPLTHPSPSQYYYQILVNKIVVFRFEFFRHLWKRSE